MMYDKEKENTDNGICGGDCSLLRFSLTIILDTLIDNGFCNFFNSLEVRFIFETRRRYSHTVSNVKTLFVFLTVG